MQGVKKGTIEFLGLSFLSVFNDNYRPTTHCLATVYKPEAHKSIDQIITIGQSNLTKSASRGPIPQLGVTPGGRNLHH